MRHLAALSRLTSLGFCLALVGGGCSKDTGGSGGPGDVLPDLADTVGPDDPDAGVVDDLMTTTDKPDNAKPKPDLQDPNDTQPDCVEGAACDDGDPCTVDDTCTAGGACVGVPKVCNAAPAPVCLSTSELRTYDAVGACQSGQCIYTKHAVTCTDGCSNDACNEGNVCTGITCNTPPGLCYAATGTCSGAGSCTYDFDNSKNCDDNNKCTVNDGCVQGVCKGAPKTCNTPPASVCEDANTVRVYDTSGSCGAATGNCSYGYGFLSCSNGCSGGQCKPSGWVQQTSNVTNTLRVVWGSSASAVWALGDGNTIVYYNGAGWQGKAAPTETTNQYLIGIHGTSANNVFAVSSGGNVLRYAGDKWKSIATVNLDYLGNTFGCLEAYADNDAFVLVKGKDYKTRLYRIKDGSATIVTELSQRVDGCGLHVYSPTNILFTNREGTFRWNGTTTTSVNADARGLQLFVGSGSATTFASTLGQSLYRWDATTVDNFTSGGLELSGLAGTALDRLFVVGSRYLGSSKYAPGILRFDGNGLVAETIPSVTGFSLLYGVWAAATGEVFAVGDNGTILKGP